MPGFAIKFNVLVKNTDEQTNTIVKLQKIEAELNNVRTALDAQTKLRIQLGEGIKNNIEEISDCRTGVINMKKALIAVINSAKGTEQRVTDNMLSNEHLNFIADKRYTKKDNRDRDNNTYDHKSWMPVDSSNIDHGDYADEYTFLKEEISVSVGSWEVSESEGLLDYSVNGELLTGSLKAEGVSALFKDGEFDPQLALYLEASGSMLASDISVRYGIDSINAYGNAEFAVGYGEAKLDAAIGKIQNEDGSVSYGAKVSAGAEICAVQGEVEGGFELFGIKVGVGAKGKAGALSAKGDAILTTDGIECSASLALLFGGEVSVAVDWSNFEFPEIDWPDIQLPKDWWSF